MKIELERINDQLERSKTLLIRALQEAEGANKQLQDTQAQLIHEQKMATLGRLAASVGHVVNNPLTILSMNVSRVILKYRKDPQLKIGDAHFARLADRYEHLNREIHRIETDVEPSSDEVLEKLKKERLKLKDEIWSMLRSAA